MIALYMGAKLIVMLTQPLPASLDPEARKQIEESRRLMRSSFQSAAGPGEVSQSL